MALDLSNRTDDDIRLAYNELQRNPQKFAGNPEYATALGYEYQVRFGRGPGAPPSQSVEDNLEAAAAPIPTDEDLMPRAPRASKPPARAPVAADRVPADAEDYRVFEAGGHAGVPGPRTDDGRPARMAPQFTSPEESAEYYVRPTDPTSGQMLPSRADEAMRANGFEPAYNASGDIIYRHAAATDGMGGIREDISPAARRRANFLVGETADTGVTVPAKWQEETVRGPFGPVRVLVPTPESRKNTAQRADQASIDRVSAITGAKPEELVDPVTRGKLLRQHNQNDLQARRAFMRTRNMLAGGSNNVNTGNIAMYNQMAMMPPESLIRQLRYALPGGDLMAAVDARQLDSAAALASRGIQGALAGTNAGPLGQAQAAALQLQNDKARMEHRQAIENQIADTYAPSGMFGYDEFTVEEQQQAIDTLMNVHHYSLIEAQDAVDRIAAGRRASKRAPRAAAE